MPNVACNHCRLYSSCSPLSYIRFCVVCVVCEPTISIKFIILWSLFLSLLHRSPIDVWQRTTAITRRTLPEDGSIIVRFEIPYARVLPPDNETPSIKKYVVYDLNIRQDSLNAWDSHPITIERRYTDFLSLYDGLRREHASLLDRVTFPKKVLIGNFSSDLIAERSAAFEAFLDHVASTPVLRESEHFLRFLQEAELTRACQLLDERRNEQAVPLLENCFRLLNKIFMDRSRSVLLMLWPLVPRARCPIRLPNDGLNWQCDATKAFAIPNCCFCTCRCCRPAFICGGSEAETISTLRNV